MTAKPDTDAHIRQEALDVSQSFLIQAPAGSGKTGLLIQRFLALLSQSVAAPEEIVAITFTRKAASEMRERVMSALSMAAEIEDPETLEPYQKTTWRFANAVLEQDKAFGWGLVSNPNRLRVQTIDSLCASLSRQSPLLSQFGSQPSVSTHPQALYEQAARALLSASNANSPWKNSLECLQRHLNNHLDRIEGLIASMLAKRDQWMPYLLPMGSDEFARENLETALTSLVTEQLMTLSDTFPSEHEEKLLSLLRFAVKQLELNALSSPILVAKDISVMPASCVTDKEVWLAIAELLVTSGNDWRKRVDKRQGFPAPSATKDPEEKQTFKSMKLTLAELIADLQDSAFTTESLRVLKLLPPTEYEETDWRVIEALIELLPLAVAHLQILFKNEGCVDFIEMAQRAEMALGSEERPTELALKLDYQIKHLLVDEFQDTSIHQYRLLGRLVAEWEPLGDRTLFLVGDPMQSIYRFRQAEVSLFIRLKQLGAFEHLPINALRLFMNYRSESAVVAWVNDSFQDIFPRRDDPEFGAVKHELAVPVKPSSDGSGSFFHIAYEEQGASQTEQIISLLQHYQQSYPEDTLAILVRSRSHLLDLLTACRQKGVAYQAQDIDLLVEQPLVQDLLALTRALTHLSDRVAWLSLLRAPYIGLNLQDLEQIATDNNAVTIWSTLNKGYLNRFDCFELTADGVQRLLRALPIIKQAVDNHRRLTLRDRVERLWLSLSGPVTLAEKDELHFAKAYFELLSEFESGADLIDMTAFEERLLSLFAPNIPLDPIHNPVQVMTMHKSKGLEFDRVILPTLEKGGGRGDQKLLSWSERTTVDGHGSLLLGPIKATGSDSNPIVQYIQEEEKKRASFERGRLLYVAATRAKKSLHLFATMPVDEENQLKKTKSDALVTPLMEQFEACHLTNAVQQPTSQKGAINEIEFEAGLPQVYYALPSDWQPSYPAEIQEALLKSRIQQDNPEINFAEHISTALLQERARLEGIFIHRILQAIAEEGLKIWQQRLNEELFSSWRAALARLGIAAEQLESSLHSVYRQISLTLEDPQAVWMLNNQHQSSVTEYEVCYKEKGVSKTAILDRMFVDQGVRWIIDYKTPDATEELTREAFLEQLRQQHAPQVNNYAKVISRLYPNEDIRCGLYVPAIQGWVHWAAESCQREENLL